MQYIGTRKHGWNQIRNLEIRLPGFCIDILVRIVLGDLENENNINCIARNGIGWGREKSPWIVECN